MTIKRTYFNDATRTWTLGGMAEAMYEGLRNRVASQNPATPSSYRGYQLAGTYNPDNPDPRRFDPPPSWLSPDTMMKATCAWNAGAMQEYLFRNGLIPLAKGLVSEEGGFSQLTKADIDISVILDPVNLLYNVMIDQSDGAAYRLSPSRTILVQPLTPDTLYAPKIAPVVGTGFSLPFGTELPGDIEDYIGWTYQFEFFSAGSVQPLDAQAFIQVFA